MLGNTTYCPQTETVARIHEIHNITPGGIATCAILVRSSFSLSFLFLLTVLIQARWALSSDVSLQEMGSSTGIRYFKDYEEYLTMLETGLQRRKKTIVNIFREWDARIFPDTDSSLAGRKPSEDNNADLKLLMELIEDDADEEGDDAGIEFESSQSTQD
jgi:hypothetical protein